MAAKDRAFYEQIIDDLIDYGYEVEFSWFGGAGAYTPHVLATERLDTPKKQGDFARSFLTMCERKAFPAKIKLSRFLSLPVQLHCFLHELTHFYQDMHGFYYAPLQEEGVFPVMPDARSMVVLTLFNEAWATVESIRAGWRLKMAGNDAAWRGAVTSPDWKGLAQAYGRDLDGGMDEMQAAIMLWDRWYEAPQRAFYERQAITFFSALFERFKAGVPEVPAGGGRSVCFADLIARMPEDGTLSYMRHLAAGSPLYTQIRDTQVREEVLAVEALYGRAEDTSISDIHCGSPPYLWKRLQEGQAAHSEHPPATVDSIAL